MTNLTRRNALVGTLAVTAAAGAARAAPGGVPVRAAASVRAFAGTHEVKPLEFDPAKLDGLSEKLIRSHWENNYQGSVKALNMIEGRLSGAMADKDLPPVVYGGLKREELHRTGSVVLHELYFEQFGGNGQAGGPVAAALAASHGSYAKLGGRVPPHRPVARWRLGLGDPRVEPPHWFVAQLLGVGPHQRPGNEHAAAGARYVRARLPDGLRRCGRKICRRLHAQH